MAKWTTQPTDILGRKSLSEVFTTDLLAYIQANAANSLSAGQNLLYALVAHALQRYRQLYTESRRSLIVLGMVLRLVGVAALSFTQLTLTYMLLHWLIPSWADRILYIQAGLNLLLNYLLKFLFDANPVCFSIKLWDDNKADRLSLGRLDHILDVKALYGIPIALGNVLGCQIGLLYNLSSHLGIPSAVNLGPAVWAGFDHLCHGSLLSLLELYDLHWLGARPVLPVWPTTVFLVYRLVYDALLVLLVYQLWRKWSMRSFYRSLPAQLDLSGLVGWIDQICRLEKGWFHKYPDEFLFLMLVKEYLTGRMDVVRHLTHQFPGLAVLDSVRELFVDPDTKERLFEAALPDAA